VIFELGQKVMTVRFVDRYPNFVVAPGETGTVSTILGDPEEPDMVGVTIDADVKGCEEWENEVQWVRELHGDPELDLVVRHDPTRDCGESCTSCIHCYKRTGESRCDRSCPHTAANYPDGEVK
jgi:hypothetical protein